MGQASLYLKDPAYSRFVAGGLAEAEGLLGSPLPLLPPPEVEQGRRVYFVRFHPRFRTLLQRFLQSLLVQIGLDATGVPWGRPEPSKDQAEYEAALARVLKSGLATDRRLGLLNLFWLAHTRDLVECLREIEAKKPAVRKLKYSLHPLLSTFYKQMDQAARREVEREDPEQAAFLEGKRENLSLVDALFEDGFAFTEASIADLDFNQFLAANKRYRLSADVFFEVYSILVRETERRVREGDRGLLSRVARFMPDLPREHYATQSGAVKIMMNSQVMNYLLGDAWGVGTKLMNSPKIRTESERRRPQELLDVFLDLVTNVKRFELVAHVRDRMALLKPEMDLEDKASKGGLRLYEFGDSAQVLNNAVSATILFLDLRGFTKTSEGQISERDLTRELYAVFDHFVPLARRFGGTVDKFLGDGIMITYGTEHADPLDPLNAVRTAVLCQQTLRSLREESRTYFKMGIAIHYGRVYLARFIADESTVQTTVIGRNVNLAGRLSSAAKRSMDEDEEGDPEPSGPRRSSGLQVTVDAQGTLFNEGIAISRDTLVQLETHLPFKQSLEGDSAVMEYFDEPLARRLFIRYAGDAKFKGVRSSFPVYEVDYEV